MADTLFLRKSTDTFEWLRFNGQGQLLSQGNSPLEEIDNAIKRFPEMAIAYARKGSIYYQMGDLQQATINWNLALKYDPEYVEVQEMLSSIKTEIEKLSLYNN